MLEGQCGEAAQQRDSKKAAGAKTVAEEVNGGDDAPGAGLRGVDVHAADDARGGRVLHVDGVAHARGADIGGRAHAAGRAGGVVDVDDVRGVDGADHGRGTDAAPFARDYVADGTMLRHDPAETGAILDHREAAAIPDRPEGAAME